MLEDIKVLNFINILLLAGDKLKVLPIIVWVIWAFLNIISLVTSSKIHCDPTDSDN